MLKIWKGPEMEGNHKGEWTLFVCSDEVISTDTILECAKLCPECKRLYLGAGRIPFNGVDDISRLCKEFIGKIIIECDAALIYTYIPYQEYGIDLICTVFSKDINHSMITFKSDDYRDVFTYDIEEHTSLITLNDKLYETDKLLLET